MLFSLEEIRKLHQKLHQHDSFNGKLESSCATVDSHECHGRFIWIKPKTLSTEQHDHGQKSQRVVRNQKSQIKKKRIVSNRDEGNLIKTNALNPVFANFIEKEININTLCQVFKLR